MSCKSDSFSLLVCWQSAADAENEGIRAGRSTVLLGGISRRCVQRQPRCNFCERIQLWVAQRALAYVATYWTFLAKLWYPQPFSPHFQSPAWKGTTPAVPGIIMVSTAILVAFPITGTERNHASEWRHFIFRMLGSGSMHVDSPFTGT